MERKEFLEELKMLITAQRSHISRIKSDSEYMTNVLKERIKRAEEMLDKLEEDYFHPNIENNIKKFDVNGNLINEVFNNLVKENSTTEQVEEGLLKIFNALVEHGEFNIGDCDFNNEKYSTSLCQIADKLLQIDSDRNLREEYYKNCTID